jgi:hypothetical protein
MKKRMIGFVCGLAISTEPKALVYKIANNDDYYYGDGDSENEGKPIMNVEVTDVSQVGKVVTYTHSSFDCMDKTGVEYASIVPSIAWLEQNNGGIPALLPLCAEAMTLVGHVPNVEEFLKKQDTAISYSSKGFQAQVDTSGKFIFFTHSYKRCLSFMLKSQLEWTETAGEIALRLVSEKATEPPCLDYPPTYYALSTYNECPNFNFISVPVSSASLLAHTYCMEFLNFVKHSPMLQTLLGVSSEFPNVGEPVYEHGLVGRMWVKGDNVYMTPVGPIDIKEEDLSINSGLVARPFRLNGSVRRVDCVDKYGKEYGYVELRHSTEDPTEMEKFCSSVLRKNPCYNSAEKILLDMSKVSIQPSLGYIEQYFIDEVPVNQYWNGCTRDRVKSLARLIIIAKSS